MCVCVCMRALARVCVPCVLWDDGICFGMKNSYNISNNLFGDYGDIYITIATMFYLCMHNAFYGNITESAPTHTATSNKLGGHKSDI